MLDGKPTPWWVFARFGNTGRYYGFPFRHVTDAIRAFTLESLQLELVRKTPIFEKAEESAKSHAVATWRLSKINGSATLC